MWSFVLACSGGPETMARIEANEHTGNVTAAIAAAIVVTAAVVVMWRTRRLSPWLLLLLPFSTCHPGLVCGARHGDCGSMVELTAWPVTIAALVAAVALIALAERYKRRHG
jgi:hypothetical protein